MTSPRASRTAVLVCQGRAVAHGRLAVGRFEDPTALQLLHEDERAPVARARAGDRPAGLIARMDVEMLGRQAEAMALRTVDVDDVIRTAGHPQLVILGAGLDGRAWRMPELDAVDVFEVDHPASQQDKRQRVADLQPTAGSLRFVPADLTHGDLVSALAVAGHDASRPTTWVLEGVIPYLTEGDAAATVASVAARSAAASTVVVTYQLGSRRAAVGRLLARGAMVLLGRGDPMANEPRRSTWSTQSVRTLLGGAGLQVVDDLGLGTLAVELGVPNRHVGGSRVVVAEVSRG